MRTKQVTDALAWKRSMEAEFKKAAGLPDRSFYSACYSLPQQSPVMWLNLNPGGSPDNYKVLSDHQLAEGKHEFWHGHGRTSLATGAFLARILRAPFARLRSVQGTNVAWQRSPSGKDIDLERSARLTAPFLRRYLDYAAPKLLMFGGSAAYDLFMEVMEAELLHTHEVLMGAWGAKQARIFMAVDVQVPGLGAVRALVVSHPSRGARAGVAERCASRVADIRLPEAIC